MDDEDEDEGEEGEKDKEDEVDEESGGAEAADTAGGIAAKEEAAGDSSLAEYLRAWSRGNARVRAPGKPQAVRPQHLPSRSRLEPHV